MNLLEHHIVEIHSEKYHDGFVEVDCTVNCWGNVSRTTHFATKDQWEAEKKRGYYIA